MTVPPTPKRPSDLMLRVISAVLLGPPVLAAVWMGGIAFDLLIALIAVLSLREWVRLAEPGKQRLPFSISLVAVAAVVATDLFSGAYGAVLVAIGATPALYLAARATRMQHRLLLAAGVPYIALSLVSLDWLRTENGEAGLTLFLFLLLSIWATDIGAYAAGRTIGGPKLAPRISPKKTWAGLIGGMVSAALAGFGVAFWAGAEKPWLALIIGAMLAVAGQAGDLFESHMKRRVDVKDSGRLIPGHGGILDRIDGLIFAAPLFALIHGLAGEWLQWW